MQCKQCQRILDAPVTVARSGPGLEESWMFLPSHRPLTSTFPLTQSTILRDVWDFNSSVMDTSQSRADNTQHPLAESLVAVHADLSDHIHQLSLYRAHSSGMPMTTSTCKDCVDTMIQEINNQAEQARHDKRSFAGYLQASMPSTEREIQEKITFYETEVCTLEENLRMMELERHSIDQQQQAILKERSALEQETLDWWQEWNAYQHRIMVFNECRESARHRMEALERGMETIRGQNVLTDAFIISSNGPFATINGFRVGQLPTVHVEWNEINAALGESALLLHTLAGMIGFEFTDFKVVPLGSFTKMIRTTNLRMEYSLHGSDQDNFIESHFNLGLGAWITCIGQLIAFVETQDKSIRLPYKISKHTINGYSILYLKNKQTEWTKALKYTFTNLKWILKWVAKRWKP